jgi:hypothetical protein
MDAAAVAKGIKDLGVDPEKAYSAHT